MLHSATDSQTFFVKTVKKTSADAAYDQTTFYEAWRLTIQRYGIYNPYTGRGAIDGLLVLGDHLRRVLDRIARLLVRTCFLQDMCREHVSDIVGPVGK